LQANHFALADQAACKLCRATLLAGAAAENKSVPAVLDDRLGLPVTVGAGQLRNRLKSKYAATAKLSKSDEGVLQAVNAS